MEREVVRGEVGTDRRADVDPFAYAEAICRRDGGRLTGLRRRILQLVREAGRPPTAYEIRDLLKPEDPAVTPAGVYRSLDFLAARGLVHRLETTKAFVACVHPDHRAASQILVCRDCGTAREADDQALAQAAEALSLRHGFAIEHGAVEISGVCTSCHDRRAHGS